MSIEVKNLSFSYGEKEVLKDVSFQAEYGQFLSVLGPNGVGKSTLFRCMLGLLKPTAGGTYIAGKSTADMTASQLSHHMAYIPQSHNPVFNYSVFDMVHMGTTGKMGNFSSPGKEQIRAADFCSGCRVQNCLRTGGQIDTQILNAIFIPAAVRNFAGVNRESLPQVFRPAA